MFSFVVNNTPGRIWNNKYFSRIYLVKWNINCKDDLKTVKGILHFHGYVYIATSYCSSGERFEDLVIKDGLINRNNFPDFRLLQWNSVYSRSEINLMFCEKTFLARKQNNSKCFRVYVRFMTWPESTAVPRSVFATRLPRTLVRVLADSRAIQELLEQFWFRARHQR